MRQNTTECIYIGYAQLSKALCLSNDSLQHDSTYLSVCLQLHETLHRQLEEIDCLQERNLHLRQLASRAKHLASVLEVSSWLRQAQPNTLCTVSSWTHV